MEGKGWSSILWDTMVRPGCEVEHFHAIMAKKLPCVTPGMYGLFVLCFCHGHLFDSFLGLLYTYLAEGSGNTSGKGAFRALQRGFNHWASGRLSKLEVNVNHPDFCHVKCDGSIYETRTLPCVYAAFKRRRNGSY